MKNNDEVKVSVCVVAYNQENYIRQCMQSIVDQETDFKFEVIVGEDCSTDGTREIIAEFQSKYPFLISPILHTENVGVVDNCVFTYKSARGKYICHMDGDDYMLPGKLQKQVDSLEKNQDCVICSHDMVVVDKNGVQLRSSFRRHRPGINTLMDLYEQLPFFANSSKMFVNMRDDLFWEELHPNALDVEVHIKQAGKGDVYHIDECLGAYRAISGVSSQAVGVNPLLVSGITRVFEAALKDSSLDKDFIKRSYAASMFRYAYQSAVRGDVLGLKKYIIFSTSICNYSAEQKIFRVLSRFPRAVVFLCKCRAFLRGYDV